jgi:hypothetical protein
MTRSRKRTIFSAIVAAIAIGITIISMRILRLSNENLLVCNESIKDFGVVERGKIILHEFALVNSTGRDVIVTRVSTNCGCVTASVSDKIVPANDTLVLPIRFFADATLGEFVKNLYIECRTVDDETTLRQITLTVKGRLAEDESLYCVPDTVNFGTLSSDECRSRTIRIGRYNSDPIDPETPVIIKCDSFKQAKFVGRIEKHQIDGPELLVIDIIPNGISNGITQVLLELYFASAMDRRQLVIPAIINIVDTKFQK